MPFSQPNLAPFLLLATLCLQPFSAVRAAAPNPEDSTNRPPLERLANRSSSLAAEQMQQVAQQQKATLVQYSLLEKGNLYIWVIPPTGEITFRAIDLQELDYSLSDLIDLSRDRIGVRSLKSRPIPQRLKGIVQVRPQNEENAPHPLRELHKLLIEPIADRLPTNPEARIAFIPQGELFLVPWAALQDEDYNYVIEKHPIFTAPSIEALSLLYQRRQQITGKTQNILVAGNPTSPPIPQPGQPPNKLSPLPGAEQEAIQIAQLWGTAPLIGDEATESEIAAQMPSARIIHLATHAFQEIEGIADKTMPGAIVLAAANGDDGFLTASEIMELPLQAELAILSSDETALGTITGDGVIGLPRSFFAAGVPTVIATLWSSSDRAMAELMVEFHRQFQRTGDTPQALRQAMLTLLEGDYPDPQAWATFILIGTVE